MNDRRDEVRKCDKTVCLETSYNATGANGADSGSYAMKGFYPYIHTEILFKPRMVPSWV